MLTLRRAELSRFLALLQRGVAVRVGAACSVFAFLVEELRLTPDYVRQRITTVFLDGQVVDVLEEAMLRQGSRLALSAAMPGLLGATLRRSGPYAAMRAEITRAADQRTRPPTGGTFVIQVKLFNLLVDEIGPALLEHGILIEQEEVHALGGAVDAVRRAPGEIVELLVRLS